MPRRSQKFIVCSSQMKDQSRAISKPCPMKIEKPLPAATWTAASPCLLNHCCSDASFWEYMFKRLMSEHVLARHRQIGKKF